MFTLLFQILVRVYQILISPFLGLSCRFHPSCSNYALQSVEHYGMWRGILYSVRRLVRCHPFSKGGYDPVNKT